MNTSIYAILYLLKRSHLANIFLFFLVYINSVPASIWLGASSNSWTTSGNWNGGVPSGASAVAEFPATAARYDPTLSSNLSIGQVIFDGAASPYTVTLETVNGFHLTYSSS